VNNTAWWSMLVLWAAMPMGCRSGDDECEATSHEDISGIWTVTRTVAADSCDPESVGEEDTFLSTVTQNGADVTIQIPTVDDLDGEVCGDAFSASGTSTSSILGCTVTQNVSVSGVVEGDSIVGRSSWSNRTDQDASCWGYDSCSGSYTLTAERR